MVAGWDKMIPAWFTRLDPRWKTPTRSIAVIVALSIAMGLLATYGTGAQEAYQVISSANNIFYGVYYLMMFAIPLVVGDRFGVRAGFWLKAASVSGLAVTLLAMGFNLVADRRCRQQVDFRGQGDGDVAGAQRSRSGDLLERHASPQLTRTLVLAGSGLDVLHVLVQVAALGR